MFQIILGILLELIVLGSYLIVASFLIWMFVDAAKQDRFWWIVIILGVPVVGAAVYYLTEKKHEYAKAPSHHVHESETESQHETAPKEHHHKKEDISVASLEVVAEEKKEHKEEKHTHPKKEDKQEAVEEVVVEVKEEKV